MPQSIAVNPPPPPVAGRSAAARAVALPPPSALRADPRAPRPARHPAAARARPSSRRSPTSTRATSRRTSPAARVRLHAAVGRARGEPDGDADPDAVGEGRPRDRPQPAGAVPRPPAAPRLVGAVGAGRGDRDVDRPGRVHRRVDRAQPAVRRAAVRRRPDDRASSRSGSSRCSRAATAASSWRSGRCSRSSCSASSTTTLQDRRRLGRRRGRLRAELPGRRRRCCSRRGILGATVMPHVIYLHSALTQERIPAEDDGERRHLLRFMRIDVLIAMALAGVVNMLMLIVAALAVPRLRPRRRRHDRGRATHGFEHARRRRRGARVRRCAARLRAWPARASARTPAR